MIYTVRMHPQILRKMHIPPDELGVPKQNLVWCQSSLCEFLAIRPRGSVLEGMNCEICQLVKFAASCEFSPKSCVAEEECGVRVIAK